MILNLHGSFLKALYKSILLLLLPGWGNNQVVANNITGDDRAGLVGCFSWRDINENNQYHIGEKIPKNFWIKFYTTDSHTLVQEQKNIDKRYFYFKNTRKNNYFILPIFDEMEFQSVAKLSGNKLNIFIKEIFFCDLNSNAERKIDFPFFSLFVSTMCTDFLAIEEACLRSNSCISKTRFCTEVALNTGWHELIFTNFASTYSSATINARVLCLSTNTLMVNVLITESARVCTDTAYQNDWNRPREGIDWSDET